MDSGSIVKIAEYAALAISVWPLCKYVIGPTFAGTNVTDSVKHVAKESYQAYQSTYNETVRQRANVTTELAKSGKTPKEISDILDSTLPLPLQQRFNVSNNSNDD